MIDALSLLDEDCKLTSKANLVAHLAREIDGGQRRFRTGTHKKKNLKSSTGASKIKDIPIPSLQHSEM